MSPLQTPMPVEEEFDVPEGRAVVVVSATLFARMVKDLGVDIILEWGDPRPVSDYLSSTFYEPVLRESESGD